MADIDSTSKCNTVGKERMNIDDPTLFMGQKKVCRMRNIIRIVGHGFAMSPLKMWWNSFEEVNRRQ